MKSTPTAMKSTPTVKPSSTVKPASAAMATTLRERRFGRAKQHKCKDYEKNCRKGFLHFSPPIERSGTACGSELR
jgi:hypothetical protein